VIGLHKGLTHIHRLSEKSCLGKQNYQTITKSEYHRSIS